MCVRDMAFAANLRMQGKRTRRGFGASAEEEVREVLALFERHAEVQLAKKGKHLGVVLGVEASAFRWKAALTKFQARVRHMAAMSLHTRHRMQAYYVISVFRFVAQVSSTLHKVLLAQAVDLTLTVGGAAL